MLRRSPRGGSISMLPLLRDKLARRDRWERILLERLTEPVHLNLLALPVLLLGSFRMKVAWDLVIRQQYAYGILKAADLARENGHARVSVIEVGVAAGAGLMNMAMIAARVQEETGVAVDIHGFDAGSGMPPARDYRDHPELYAEGDFPMDVDALRRILPPNVTLHIGPLSSTVPAFLERCTPAAPIGFVAFDVDYYSSTVEALGLLKASPELYLPVTVTYLDDIALQPHNSSAGVLLAIEEFNASTALRQVERHPFFTRRRIFTRAIWVQQVFFLHVLDHPTRSRPVTSGNQRIIDNPYLATGAAPR